MFTYQYSRPLYSDDSWSDMAAENSESKTLHECVFDSLGKYGRLRADGEDLFIDFEDELTAEEETSLASIVSSFDPGDRPEPPPAE